MPVFLHSSASFLLADASSDVHQSAKFRRKLWNCRVCPTSLRSLTGRESQRKTVKITACIRHSTIFADYSLGSQLAYLDGICNDREKSYVYQ